MALEELKVYQVVESTDKEEYSHLVTWDNYISKIDSMLIELPDEIDENSTAQLICFGIFTPIQCNTSLLTDALQGTSSININPIQENINTAFVSGTTIQITLNDSTIFETNIELVTNDFQTIRLRDQLPEDINKGNNISFKINEIKDYTHNVTWSTNSDKIYVSSSGYTITMSVDVDTSAILSCTYGTTTFDKEIIVKNRI